MAIDVKGLVREYIVIIILHSLDLGAEIGCYSEIVVARLRYEGRLVAGTDYRVNSTAGGFGVCQHTRWDREEYRERVIRYSAISTAYLFFIIISGGIFICYLLAYLGLKN